jgi:outer membrane protein assembly factor BamB
MRWTTISCSVLVASLILPHRVDALADRPNVRFAPVTAWTMVLNNALATTPAFAGDRGYFPLEADRLAAYDLVAGSLLWVVKASPKSQPAVGDGLVFFVEEAVLTALREDDGKQAWQVPFAETLAAPLAWEHGWLIAATTGGTIIALRATDGMILWQRGLGAPAHASPSLAGDRAYVPLGDGRVVVLKLEDGGLTWQRRLGGAPNAILALDERLYVGSDDNRFYCLRTQDGELVWRWVTGADVVGMPLVDEQRVYFVSLDNVVRSLDRNSGAQRWKRGLTLRPAHRLVKVGDVLLVAGAAATLSAFNIRDGTPAGQIPAGGELAAAPHVLASSVLPRIVVVARDIAKGAIVTMFVRSIDPPAEASIGTLPNVIPQPKAP